MPNLGQQNKYTSVLFTLWHASLYIILFTHTHMGFYVEQNQSTQPHVNLANNDNNSPLMVSTCWGWSSQTHGVLSSSQRLKFMLELVALSRYESRYPLTCGRCRGERRGGHAGYLLPGHRDRNFPHAKPPDRTMDHVIGGYPAHKHK